MTHISYARYTETSCVIKDCPTCERPRRMLCQFQEWYGSAVTCVGCGDSWQDGERRERPFAPDWRRKRIEHARKGLKSIGVTS